MSRIKVVKSDPPETVEVMAEAIRKIADMAQQIKDGPMTEEAVVILLHHKTKVSMTNIRTILRGLRQLKGWYLKDG